MSKRAISMTDTNGNTIFPICAESGDGWVRFADGTQICWGSYVEDFGGTNWGICSVENLYCLNKNVNVVFAKSFLIAPNVSLVHANGSTVFVSDVMAVNTGIQSVNYFRPYTNLTSLSATMSYIAIGRWR